MDINNIKRENGKLSFQVTIDAETFEKAVNQAYLKAKKEFINCLIFSPICLFVPLYNAFFEWLPIMRAERKKEQLG